MDFQAWDREALSKTSDFEGLYQRMLRISKESPENVEIWWRMSFITYQTSLNYLDDDTIAAKTREALQYAEKAKQLDCNHFYANLWLASASGKLALMETGMETRIKYDCYKNSVNVKNIKIFLTNCFLPD